MANVVVDTEHWNNLEKHREWGRYWEEQFCKLAAKYGKSFTANQIGQTSSARAFFHNGRRFSWHVLPDITLWTAPGEHHEIKHKNPTWRGEFGLEDYRLEALLWFAGETGQSVYYTIHNHDLAGGRDVRINDIAHWVTVNVLELDGTWIRSDVGDTYYNGGRGRKVRLYWDIRLWRPLESLWTPVEEEIPF